VLTCGGDQTILKLGYITRFKLLLQKYVSMAAENQNKYRFLIRYVADSLTITYRKELSLGVSKGNRKKLLLHLIIRG
jgi:hypothetical protein